MNTDVDYNVGEDENGQEFFEVIFGAGERQLALRFPMFKEFKDAEAYPTGVIAAWREIEGINSLDLESIHGCGVLGWVILPTASTGVADLYDSDPRKGRVYCGMYDFSDICHYYAMQVGWDVDEDGEKIDELLTEEVLTRFEDLFYKYTNVEVDQMTTLDFVFEKLFEEFPELKPDEENEE